MFRKILVPLDGSERAEWAMKPALALTMETDAELILLRVPVSIELPIPVLTALVQLREKDDEEKRRECENYLRAKRHAHFYSYNVKSRAIVAEGDVARVIVDTAVSESVDLIIMTTHGRSGLARWALGSVSEKVLTSALHPVMMLRDDALPTHILVALDGSVLSEASLPPALLLAQHFGARVTLLRVIDRIEVEPETQAYLAELEKTLPRPWQQEACAAAEEYLREVAQRQPIEVETAVVLGEPPANGILKFAEESDVDLIAMTTHGKTGEDRWPYGSVTGKVLHGSSKSMLVVRSSLI